MMSELHKDNIMSKIIQVKSGETSAIAATEWDITVKASENDRSEIIVDLVAHYIISNEEASDTMTVSYATANSLITNASQAYAAMTKNLMGKIIDDTLKGLNVPNGTAELARITNSLKESG